MGRALAERSLGACKAGVVGGEVCWQLQWGSLCACGGTAAVLWPPMSCFVRDEMKKKEKEKILI